MANCRQEVNKTVRNKTQIRIVIINLLNLLRFFCRLTDIYLLMDFEIR
ncbi:hypothetical protein HMPREF3156_00617 [Neisseria sp. HMSC06F02]|nr:hypothetical protein HMPREF3156_00617 [Neisseria sp. HMSC06F02]